ncbi:YbaB/EbfC family nucleoid-associated protein [Actinomadura rubrisoli]|uniref:YbaB/EbfC family nucleoid-associated protein n=1 Tax=Actinomadura rubrisoli TaxID=2530368 RepID=UPI001404C82A|nr:YbaB/EbfC family nucleoid-associated protein [Actinomadura rubrisoli]
MKPTPKSLRELLNSDIQDAPLTPAEVRRRLGSSAGRRQAEQQTRPVGPPSESGQCDEPSAEPAPTMAKIIEPSGVGGGTEGGPAEDDDSPSLDEVATRLAARALEFAECEARLARETISAEALNGRLRVVVTGNGRPVSLHVDREALHGSEGRLLGKHISDLIMTARQQADVRRDELEAGLSSPATEDPMQEGRA